MSFNYQNSTPLGAEDDDEYEEKSVEEFNIKEFTIYAIDCRPSMLKKDIQKKNPVTVALESIREKCLDKIDTRPNDQMGIVLFGTTEKNNMADKEHIYVLQPLDILDAPRIKEIDLLIHDPGLIKERYGSSDALFPISDLFWVCSDIMSNAAKFSCKRLVIITDNDDPTGGNPTYRKTAIQRVKDLNQVGVDNILFGLDGEDHIFDRSLFYKDIVNFADTVDDQDDFKAQVLSSTGNLEDLFNKIKTVRESTRSGFSLPFEIGPGLTIGIRGYNMVLEQKVGSARLYFAEGEQTQEVQSQTRWICVDTNEHLTPIDIRKAFSYGGEHVVFTTEDWNQLRKVNKPGLRVLGFRDHNGLMPHHQISHPYFIYPDESQYHGSKRAFFLLLNSLTKKGKIAICSFVRGSNTTPKIVALLPQPERLDKDGIQLDPPGFQLIVLPFAEEIRQVPPHKVVEGHQYEHGVRLVKPIIDKMMIKEGYNPANYHNPYLVNHKNMIQKAALDTEFPTKIVDNSVPNYMVIEGEELSSHIEEFKKSVGLDTISRDELLESSITNAKRKAPEQSDSQAKKPKAKKDMTITEHWENNTLNFVTNNSLKEFLISVQIQPKKLKADLVDQVHCYLKTKTEPSTL